jgi:hypothetical protein
MEARYISQRMYFEKKDTVIEVPRDVQFISSCHSSVKIAFDRNLFDKKIWDNSLKFAFVRNPWDRLVSIWLYYSSFRLGKVYPSNYALRTFDAFVMEVIRDGKWRYSLDLRNSQPYFNHVLPQTTWLSQGVNYIGRFENFDKDWSKVCSIMGIPYKRPMQTNSTSHYHYSYYYNDKTRKIVEDFYTEEIGFFRYKFERQKWQANYSGVLV